MSLLVLWLACVNPRPHTEEAVPVLQPPPPPGPGACVEACMQARAMEAVGADAIRAGCEQQCAGGPIVRDRGELALQSGRRITVEGTLVREPMRKGDNAWAGTALRLDDGTLVWVTYTDPPHGWEGLVGRRVRVAGTFWDGPPPAPPDQPQPQMLVAPHLVDVDAPIPVEAP